MVYLNRDSLLGYTKVEIETGQSLMHAVRPDDRQRVQQHWMSLRYNTPGQIEYRLQSKSGSWEWLRSRETVLERAEDGVPTQVMITLTVITGQKHAEAQLQLLESVTIHATDAVLVTKAAPLDEPGPEIIYVNESFSRMTGYAYEEVVGNTPRMLQGPLTDRPTLERIRHALTRWQPIQVELVNYHKDGTPFWVEISIVPVADDRGCYSHWVSVQRDITARKQAEHLEHDRARVLEMIAQQEPLPDILAEMCRLIERQKPTMRASVLQLKNNCLYHIAAPSIPLTYQQAINGTTAGPMVGACGAAMYRRELVICSDIAHDPLWLGRADIALSHGFTTCWSLPLIAKTGDVLGTFALYHDSADQPAEDDVALVRAVGHLAAIAIEQAHLIEQLAHNAYHDDLTGLPNRALFRDRLTNALAVASRQASQVAVLLVDLDRFKPINDTLGHGVGDQVLQQLAQRLSSVLRQSDTLARMSGDEFTIVLPNLVSPEDAVRVGYKLLEAIQQPFRVDNHDLFVSASIGISIAPDDGTTASDLVRHADLAMFRAKTSGRNQLCCFAPELNAAAQAKLELETDLRTARERGDLQLYYQPQIDLRQGCVVGVEALLRWKHPVQGWISPAVFIPVAEESGLILSIGAWVLEEACRQAMVWREQGHSKLTVAVNVSAVQFAQTDFADTVARALRATGLPPAALELEVTESMVMRDVSSVVERLTTLRTMGVKIAIDDFGTGYSSLAYLQRLPLDRIKIDRAFVNELSSQPIGNKARSGGDRARAVVQTIVTLAHSLGLQAVAEGVETNDHAAILYALGCDQAQGYLFARPLPAAQVSILVGDGTVQA
jgi:diguanylate cyclase (GGDEF)-like protein/PAS domain S-box-containing protein